MKNNRGQLDTLENYQTVHKPIKLDMLDDKLQCRGGGGGSGGGGNNAQNELIEWSEA